VAIHYRVPWGKLAVSKQFRSPASNSFMFAENTPASLRYETGIKHAGSIEKPMQNPQLQTYFMHGNEAFTKFSAHSGGEER
jgi:hypothetical protein